MTEYTKEMDIGEIIKELARMRNELVTMTNSIESIIKNLVVMVQIGGDTE